MVFVYQKNVSDTTTIPEGGAGRTNYLQTEVYEYHHLDWVDTKYNAPLDAPLELGPELNRI